MAVFSKLVSGEGASKWQLGLAISIPIAVGLGIMYYNLKIKNKGVVIIKDDDLAKVAKDKAKVSEKLTPSKEADLRKNEGNDHFRKNNYEEAIRCYSEALALCPDGEKQMKSTFFQNRAAAYERMGEHEKVIEDCTEALKLNPYYIKAIGRRAKAYEKVKKYEFAAEDLAALCMLERFENQDSINDLDRVSKGIASVEVEKYIVNHVPQLPSRFFIKTYMSTYQHGSAIDKLNTDDSVASALLTEYKKIYDRFLNASSILEECSELIKKCEEAGNEILRMEALMLQTTYYILSKQNKKAMENLEIIIADENVDPRVQVSALIKRGTLYQHEGNDEKRLEDFKKAIEIDENNPDIYHHLGQVNLILGKHAESVDNFRKAVALDPDFPITAVQHCFAEFKYAMELNDTETMLHYLKQFPKIMEKYPNNTECITLYAQVLAERREFAQAEKLFDEAIAREPGHAALFVHKALLALQWQGDVEVGKNLIRKALELDSNCEFAYETIATIELQMGNYQEALRYYDEAIKRYTSTEELFHLFCMRISTLAQVKAEERVGRVMMQRS